MNRCILPLVLKYVEIVYCFKTIHSVGIILLFVCLSTQIHLGDGNVNVIKQLQKLKQVSEFLFYFLR